MADIFISYARKSRPDVRRLAEALEAEGWSVWWDAELLGGTEVEHSIRAEIAAARCMVVVWTHHSITRPFVLDEARLGQAEGKLVPTRFEQCSVPLGFGNLHAVDLWDWRGDPQDESFLALSRAIERLAPRESDGAAAHGAKVHRKRVGSRVAVTYPTKVEMGAESFEIPFSIGVLGDFLGHVEEGGESIPFRKRRFVDITRDTFDDVMKHFAPRLVLQVENRLEEESPPWDVVVTFEGIRSFSPSKVALQVDPLRKLLDLREDLEALRCVLGVDDQRSALQHLAAAGFPLTFRAIESLSRGVPFPSEEWDGLGLDEDWAYCDADEVQSGDPTPLEAARESFAATLNAVEESMDWSSDRECDRLGSTLAARIESVDTLISLQLDPVLHHPDFQALESRWRGLRRLVENAGDGALVRIRILPGTLDEVLYSFERAQSREESALFQRIYGDEVGTTGGLPFGMIVADYDFDHHPRHVALLWYLGDVASVAGLPVGHLGGSDAVQSRLPRRPRSTQTADAVLWNGAICPMEAIPGGGVGGRWACLHDRATRSAAPEA